MTFSVKGFQTLGLMGTPDGTAGSRRQIHTYITADSPATVETSDYFKPIYARLTPNDLLIVSYATSPKRCRTYVFDAAGAGGVTILREDEDDPAATPPNIRSVVATDDGLETGLILDTDTFVEITNGGSVDNFSTLPACSEETRGREIRLYAKTADSELRTPADSDDTINGVNCGSAEKEALLTAGCFYIARQVLADGWLLQEFGADGDIGTAIVPD